MSERAVAASAAPTAVILGSPKSGTSVTAGVVHHLGFTMGPNLRAGDSRNPRGYFEDREFLVLHDRVLVAAGGSSWDLPTPAAVAEAVAPFRDEIAELVAARSGDGPWGLKTGPRLVEHVLPFLADPRLVLVTRNPLDTARSAVDHVARPDFGLKEAMAHGADTFEQCVDLVRRSPEPAVVLSYEQLTTDPDGSVRSLAASLGVDDPDRIAEAIAVVASRAGISKEREASRRHERSQRAKATLTRVPRSIAYRAKRLRAR